MLARGFRRFCLGPHFKGKSTLERLVEPIIPFPVPARFPDGFVLQLNGESAFERSLFFRDCEAETSQFFRQVLKPGMTFMDCGANIGFYTLLASRLVGPQGRVFSFEPTPSSFQRLQGHLRENQASNVTALAVGLGAADGRTAIFQNSSGDNHGMNSLFPAPDAASIGDCEIRTIDGLLDSGAVTRPEVLKIDVEGAELPMLIGGSSLFRGPRAPIMVIELSNHTMEPAGYSPEDLVRFILAKRPYRIEWRHAGRTYHVDPDRPLPHYAPLGRMHGSNYFFFPAD